MDVNLYVTIPTNHPGANPKFANYLGGSSRSVAWALAHGAPMLIFHATLGLTLVVLVIGVAVYAVRLRSWVIGALSVIAGLLVIEAGFKGASFLDFQNNSSSLIMALLAFGALACYSAVLYLLTTRKLARAKRARGLRAPGFRRLARPATSRAHDATNQVSAWSSPSVNFMT